MTVVETILQRFQTEGDSWLTSEYVSDTEKEFIEQADMRFQGQSHELTVTLPQRTKLDREALIAEMHATFCDEHQRVYGFADRREPSELVNVRMTVVGRIRRPTLPSLAKGGPDASEAVTAQRRVYFAEAGSSVDCTIYNRQTLAAENRIPGPAIVEEYDSTTVIPPDFAAEVDVKGNLILRWNGVRGESLR